MPVDVPDVSWRTTTLIRTISRCPVLYLPLLGYATSRLLPAQSQQQRPSTKGRLLWSSPHTSGNCRVHCAEIDQYPLVLCMHTNSYFQKASPPDNAYCLSALRQLQVGSSQLMTMTTGLPLLPWTVTRGKGPGKNLRFSQA